LLGIPGVPAAVPVAAVMAAEVATQDPLGVRVRCAPPQWGACTARAGRR